MTHFERFQLRKSYNPDLTIGKEIERTQNEIQFAFKDWNENSDTWGAIKVDEWCRILKDKKDYIKFLKNYWEECAKS